MVRLWAIASLAVVLVVGIGIAAYVMRAPDQPVGTVSQIVSEPNVPAKPSGDSGSDTKAATSGTQAESGGQAASPPPVPGDQAGETPKPASETATSAESRAGTPALEQPLQQAEPSVAAAAEKPSLAEPAPTELQPVDTTADDDPEPAAGDPAAPAPKAAQSADTTADDDPEPAAGDPAAPAPKAVQTVDTTADDDPEPAAGDPVAAAPKAAQTVDTTVDDDLEPAASGPAEEQVAALPGTDEGAETTAVPVETEEAAALEQAPKAPSPQVLPPSFDIVRIERSGETVIAGRGMPGSEVQILLNGEIIGRTTSDGRGQWVFLPRSPLPPGNHQLSLRSRSSGGEMIESVNIVVVVIPEIQVASPAQESTKEADPEGVSQDPAKSAAKTDPAAPAKTAMAEPDEPDTTTEPPAGTVRQADRIAATVEGASSVKAEIADPGSSDATVRPAEQVQEALSETSAGDQQGPAETVVEMAEETYQAGEAVTEIATIPVAGTTASRDPEKGNAASGETAPGDAEPTAPAESAARSEDGTETAEGEEVGQTAATARIAATESLVSPGLEAAEPEQSQDPLVILLPRGGQGGAKILQDPGQTGVSDLQLVLRSVDYDAKGNVTISGEAAPGARVIVYLDNEAIGQGVVGAAGRWRFTPKRPVPSGLHRLRVDQLDDQGGVVARVETPFSRAAILTDLPREKFVVVQPGNSLWRIARAVYGEGLRYTVIHQSNSRQIRDPDLIYPGQIFMVPRVN